MLSKAPETWLGAPLRASGSVFADGWEEAAASLLLRASAWLSAGRGHPQPCLAFIVVFIMVVQQFRALPAVSRAKAQPVPAPTSPDLDASCSESCGAVGALFTWIGTHGMLNDLIFPFPCSTSVIAHLLPSAVEVGGCNSLC